MRKTITMLQQATEFAALSPVVRQNLDAAAADAADVALAMDSREDEPECPYLGSYI